MKRPKKTLFFLFIVILIFGCAQTKEAAKTKTGKGAAIGAAGGAIAGAVIGHQSGHRGAGALIGGVTGAIIGGAIGYKLDQQAKELEQIPDTHVEKKEDRLVVTMSDSVLFDENSAILKSEAKETLSQTADVMVRYPDSDILVKGHTDSSGSEAYNQELSERRAKMVQNFLIAQGVSAARITAIGFGKTMPVAPNDTPQNRQKNRRVEIEIKPRPENAQ
ncbi:OmpA/MotB domain protein [uncultured Desulfobacterium sp.]|uniref:OmpA/MotB domain protein n=1 Tax=uncultured Desulfobacterium sp. TaxID=201089 RepID=A0A445MX23_9BACT|nr:OmpA/MotB domain protein [uncultured Desulfobacterium sp.]